MQDPSRRRRQALLGEAFEQGIRHFDVARMYGLGAAESELGRFARGRRDQITIATKFGIDPSGPAGRLARLQAPGRAVVARFPALRAALKQRRGELTDPRRYDAQSARASLQKSLIELATDYVDFFFVHDPSAGDHIHLEGLQEACEDLRQAGYIRAWGISGDPQPCIDLIHAAGPHTILQVRDDIFNPVSINSESPVITFGILSSALGRIHGYLSSDGESRSRWSRAIGKDCGDPEAVASLLVQDALDRNRKGAVLFSTTQPPRLEGAMAAARAISQDPQLESLRVFRECVSRDMGVEA